MKLLSLLLSRVGVRAMVTAPINDTLRLATMQTCLDVWPREIISEVIRSEGHFAITLVNQSVAYFRSTDNPDHLRGPNLGVVWMDEGALSDYEAWLVLLGTLREEPGRAFVTTTPAGFNWVYREFAQELREGYELINTSTQANFKLSPQYLKTLRESYQGDYALQEIEGRFVALGGGCVFDVGVLAELNKQARDGETFRNYVVGRRYVAALDPAGEGEDRHSLSVLDCQTGEYVVDLTLRVPVGEFALRAHQALRAYQEPMLQVEPNGVGLAMVEAMRGLGYRRFWVPDPKNGKVGQPMGSVLRDRLIVGLSEGIRQGALVIYSKKAIDELFSFVRHPKTGKAGAAQGAHDDRAVAMMWANWLSGQAMATGVGLRAQVVRVSA